MNDYAQIGISHLSPRAISKLSKGGMIRVQEGPMMIHMSPEKVKKLISKFRKGKGGMVSLDQSEIGMNGSGFFSSIKKVGNKVGNILKSKEFKRGAYKTSIVAANIARPLVKQGANQAIDAAASALITSNPELAPVIIPLKGLAKKQASKAIDKPSMIIGRKDYDKGAGIYAGRQYGEGIYAGMGMGTQGRNALSGHPAIQTPKPLDSQHFNQQLRQYM
jgi:hypothetical protein